MFSGLSVIFLSLSHLLCRNLLKWSRAKGFGIERIVLIGFDKNTRRIANKIESMNNSVFQLAGYIQTSNEERQPLPEDNSPFLGKLEDIVSIINDHMIERIIVSESSLTQEEFLQLVQTCEKMEVQLDRIPDFIGFTSGKIHLSEIDGVVLLGVRKIILTQWDHILKRIFDLIVAIIATVVLFPLLIIIAFLIKLDSKGPVFFRQKRIGKGERSFYFIKFRSMEEDAEKKREKLSALNEAEGFLFKIKNDPRITRIGKFIRKFSIDELASLWNVLIGEMSLVGPRPLVYSDMKNELENPKYKYWKEKRAEVPPGMTGLWQTSGRSDLSFDDMVRLDLYYVENWSLLLDLKILLKTIPLVFSGKGSY